MQSHTYQFTRGDWLRYVLAPIGVCIAIVAAAQFIAWSGFLPQSGPTEFVDDVVVAEKSAPRQSENVDLLFVGDSSCLMGFSATDLEAMTPGLRVYNLGTLSTLGLEKFGDFTREFVKRSGGGIQTIVLLISPEMVHSGSVRPQPVKKLSAEAQERLRELQFENEQLKPALARDFARDVAEILALPLLKTQLVARVFETPFAGSYALAYGFPEGLREHLRRERGSAIDPTDGEPGHIPPRGGGARDVFVSDAFKSHCEALRKAIPPGVRLLVGLTPIPGGGREYEGAFRGTLRVLQEYLHADGILTNLPAGLPGHFFSTSTHLNAEGARQYTHALARALRGETRMIAARKMERQNGRATAQGGPGALGSESGNASP